MLELEAVATAGRVREFRREDVPAVVALRQQVFRLTERESPRDLAGYLDYIFFDRVDDDVPRPDSFVFEDADGRLGGFLGIIARRMEFSGRMLDVRIGTQLMVAPGTPGIVGKRLVRAFIESDADLLISDTANDAARRIWESIGGRVAVAHSLSWVQTLRPARFLAARHARSLHWRAASFALRPAITAFDAVTGGVFAPRPALTPGDHVVALDIARDLHEMQAILARWPLRPAYDAESLAWILKQAARKRGCESLRQCSVRDARGRMLGWFVYCAAPGGVSQVLQLASLRAAFPRVLAQLIDCAWRDGAAALSGRLEPLAARHLSAAGASFIHEGPWVLVHSRDPEILGAIAEGNAFVSRLDGEWWLGF